MDVTVRPGQRITIRLPGLATAGYRWSFHVDGDTDAIAVSLSTAADVPGRAPTAGVDEMVVIVGQHPGRATVTLEQRRAWENAATPQDRRVLIITVS